MSRTQTNMNRAEAEGSGARIIRHAGGVIRSQSRHAARQRSARGGTVQTRTVVKAKFSFVRSKAGKISPGGVQRVKDSANYYAHRPDKEGERSYRAGFSAEQDELSKHAVAKFIDGQVKDAEKAYVYRIVLSPGAAMDEEQIRDWTRATLERQGVTDYVAFAHAGEQAHTPHDHVHVLTFRGERMTGDEFKSMRIVGDDEEQKQIKAEQIAERDREREIRMTAREQEDVQFGG